MSIADVITDAFAYAQLREVAVFNDWYTAAYAVILCFGVVTTGMSLAYRFRNAHLMRAQVLELGKQDHQASVTGSAARRQAQQHEWELAQTHRTKVILSIALLSVVAQGACDTRARMSRRAARVRRRGRRSADVRHELSPHIS
jgi:hypothetical protein